MQKSDAVPALRPDEPARRAGSRGLLAIVVAVGVAFDLWAQTRLSGTAFAVGVVLLVAGLVLYGELRGAASLGLAAAAIVLALFLALRSNVDLLTIDVLAIALLLVMAIAVGTGHDLFDLTPTELIALLGAGIATQIASPISLARVVRTAMPARVAGDSERIGAVVRGVLLAIPIVFVVGGALASADAVFASYFTLDFQFGDVVPHAFAITVGACVACGAFVLVANPPMRERTSQSWRVSLTEGVIVLVSIIGVYGLFAMSRLVVTMRGASYVEEVTGLTYAEYARSGFFQLLWAAGITVLVLMVLRGAIETASPRAQSLVGALSAIAAALTLVVVHTAIVRLGLYEEAFGLTLLRFASTAAAWWIGLAIVLTAVSLAGVWRGRAWLTGAVLCSAIATLVLVNVVDPEAYVTERNLARAAQGSELDLGYLLGLSDDALVVLADSIDHLDDVHAVRVVRQLCSMYDPEAVVAWNLAAQRVAAEQRSLC